MTERPPTVTRPNPLMAVLRHGPLMWLLSCSTAGLPIQGGPFSQFCPADTTPGSGNLDHPAQVALAVQDVDNRPRAYAVAVNPDQRQARAVDLTAGLMVPAPNVYFPMAVKLDSFTEHIAASKDGRLAVTMDGADRRLRFFHIGPVSRGETWRRTGDVVDLPPRPVSLSARGPANDQWLLVAHAGTPPQLSVLHARDGSILERHTIPLDGIPVSAALNEDATVAVVSSALNGQVTVVNVRDTNPPAPPFPTCASSAQARPCTLDVGGPSHGVVVGTQPTRPYPGAPRYPVALALRSDTAAVAVIRLAVELTDPPLSEPVDRVEALVQLPRPAVVAALAPEGAPLCCVGGYFTAAPQTLRQGGFAYAVVAMMDGTLIYLDLNAKDALGRRTPRLMDQDPLPPSPPIQANGTPLDLNTDTDAGVYREPTADGGTSAVTATQPLVKLEYGPDGMGDPPLINQLNDEDYRFTYEGVLPRVSDRTGHATPALLLQSLMADDAVAMDLRAAGVRPSDVVEIRTGTGCPCPPGEPDCVVAHRLTVLEAVGPNLRVDGAFTARACLTNPAGFRYRVRVSRAFVVEALFAVQQLGRVGFFEPVEVPGVRITLWPAGWQGGTPEPPTTRDGGVTAPEVPINLPPPPRDSWLTVPIRSNFKPFVVDGDDVTSIGTVFIPANAVPTGLVVGMAPVLTGTGTGAVVQYKAVGLLSTAGGGLLMQFDLGVHPMDPNGLVARANQEPAFKFFE